MISRAARASRICIDCRTRLTQRSTTLGLRVLPIRGDFRRRRFFSSDSDPKDVDIDAIIAKKFASIGEKKTSENHPKPDRFNFENDFNLNSREEAGSDGSIVEDVDRLQLDGIASKYNKTENEFASNGPREHDILNESSTESSKATPSKPDFTFSDDVLPTTNLPESASQRPTRKLRHRLLENAPLGVSALGVEADAIYVRNPNKMKHDKPITTEIDEKPMETSFSDIDWSKISLEHRADEGVVERAEIWNNIDEMRPDTKALRMKDYEKLSRALFNGFTTAQLRDYIREAPHESESIEINLGNYSWIAKQMPWAPFRTLQTTQLAYKYAYIHKLITQKWNVQIQDFVDDLGQAFIWIDPHYFPFLLRGHGAFLKNARKDFIDEANNEKLSTTSSECRINITSRKASTYAILERLDRYFKRVEDRMLPLGELTKTIPKLAELDDLARITSTSLKLRGKGKDAILQVSLFGDKKHRDPSQPQNEGKADTVLRLLTTRPTRGLVEKVEFIPSLDSAKGLFIGHNRERRSMAWNDRLRKWFRYVAPLGKAVDTAALSLGLAKTASLPQYANNQVDSPNVTTATFGHILHSQVSKSTTKIASSYRLLSPVTPHPAAFSALKPDKDEELTQKTAIVLKFAPHVDRSTKPEHIGPPVRLTVPLTSDTMSDDYQIPEGSTLEAVVPWHIDDVVLASQSVDVRLANERRFPLDISHSKVQEFLGTAKFNLRDGRLQTPKDVTLSIPEQWQSAGSKSEKKSNATINVLYDFRGIEIHQTIEMPWQGHTLRYSVIEAGQHGGKRQEISLQAGLPGVPITNFKNNHRENFLQCVEDVAIGKFWSWDEGFKSVKVQQFEDFSYDLPERELGEDFVVSEFDAEAEAEAVESKKTELLNQDVGEELAVDEVTDKPQLDAEPAVVERKPLSDLSEPKISEKDFFKHFSARAGDQLDQFKTPVKKRKGKKRQAQEEESLDDDDPFKIHARPVRALAPSGTKASSASADNTNGDMDIFEQGTADDQFALEEWDEEDWYDEDIENFDDIEDNELSTEEIEAELIKALGLENHPDQPISPEASDESPSESSDTTPTASQAEAPTIQVKDAAPDKIGQ